MTALALKVVGRSEDAEVTETELLALLGISRQSCKNWRSTGYGPAFRKVDYFTTVYRVRDLNKWLARERPIGRTRSAGAKAA